MLSVCYFVFIFPWKYPSFYLLSVFIEGCYPNTLYSIFCDFCIRQGAIIHRWPLLSLTWPRHNVMVNTEAIQGPDTGEDVTAFKHNKNSQHRISPGVEMKYLSWAKLFKSKHLTFPQHFIIETFHQQLRWWWC